ncbi:MAG: 30S ribosomal protein S6 [Phycisphaerae bacterium]
METDQKRTYEGMFLMDAGQDFETAREPIEAILQRYGAEMLSIKPWDERKLAYSLDGRKRGLYVLTYFALDPSQLDEIEHDCHLDERILRVLFLRKEELSEEDIQAETPATAAAGRREQQEQKAEADAEADKSASEQSESAESGEESAEETGGEEQKEESSGQEESASSATTVSQDSGESESGGESEGETQEDK